MRLCPKYALSLFATAACACVAVVGVRAADDDAAASADDAAMKEEMRYITALVDANLPDFAEPVIAAAKKKWPQLGPKLKVLELQGDLRLGKFEIVQKVIDGIKDKKSGDYWALRLAMADAYYARGMLPECSKIYKEFFAAVPKPGPDLIDFYVNSGFKWAQMCVNERQYDEATKMYDGLLARPLEEGTWCLLASEQVDLLLRLATEAADPKQAPKRAEYLKRAEKYVDDMLWKRESQPLYFGKAVAFKAHITMLRGKLEEAQGLVNTYMEDLANIHKALLEQDPDGREGYMKLSPMPECRYLLASVLWRAVQDEAKKPKANEDLIKDSLFGARKGSKRNGAGAYNHAINVFVKYPESKWAANAGELANAIEGFVKARYKKEIKTNVTPDQMKKVRRLQFENADEDFRNNNFPNAVKAYGDILAQFPEVEESIGAVANLAESWLNLWQTEKDAKKKEEARLSADAVEGYLAERFSGINPDFIRPAGDAVLRLAAKERDMGALPRAQALYDAFFDNFPTHYNAPQLALTLGARAYQAEDWEGAIVYYTRIATQYTNSTSYANALNYLASSNGKLGNVEEQEKWLRLFVQTTKKPMERTSAQLALALMQQKRGFAAFEDAAETNEADRATLQRSATIAVIKAIKDFNAVADDITKILEDKTVSKADREKFLHQREQAIFLVGESWQRLQMPIGKFTLKNFRERAAAAYEKYLSLYPQGEYGPVALVKIGTIWTAEQDMEKSQDAFARLQKNFPDSDEAKNSVPRLAKTLIEMGLRADGVKQYKLMLETSGGKYTAGQFLAAGTALQEAKEWDVALEAYAKALSLAQDQTNITTLAMIGQAKAHVGAKHYAEAHEILERFIEKHGKSRLVIDAYEMLVEVASEEGRVEKNDDLRRKFFNEAVSSVKKLRSYRENDLKVLRAKKEKVKDEAEVKKIDEDLQRIVNELDVLSLRSADILVRKMDAEETMKLADQAKETCGLAVVSFQTFLMAHEPTDEHPAKDMTAAQLANLERCYGTVLPLMAKIGKSQAEDILRYGKTYVELFPNGKHKTAVQNAINQAESDK